MFVEHLMSFQECQLLFKRTLKSIPLTFDTPRYNQGMTSTCTFTVLVVVDEREEPEPAMSLLVMLTSTTELSLILSDGS